MVTVYNLYSESTSRYYVGFTQDISKRMKKHRAGQNRSTSYASDWELIWSKEMESSLEARKLDKRIKSRGASRFLEDIKG